MIILRKGGKDVNTELYRILYTKLISSGVSKRAFAKHYGLSHAWFIDFMNPSIEFRPLQIKTMGILYNNLDIPIRVCEDYNRTILAYRNKRKGDR